MLRLLFHHLIQFSYHQMVEVGILNDRHVELLDGEIVEMSPETPIHYATAKQGTKYLEQLLLTLLSFLPAGFLWIILLSLHTHQTSSPNSNYRE